MSALLQPLTRAAAATRILLGRSSPPPGLDATPRTQVLRRDKLALFRIDPAAGSPRGTPLLLIPPLMVRPYIYDLQPDHSLLATLRDAGWDVFLVDFGVPDSGDRGLRLDDYVLDFVPRCVDATLAAAGAERLALVGYCMGGLFGLIHVATHRDHRVAALATIGAPVNFRKMGAITVAAHLGAPVMDGIIDVLGNIPGALSSAVFKLISLPRVVRSYRELLRRDVHDDAPHLLGVRAINHWLNDMIPYPQEAYRQMFNEVVLQNRLPRGELVFGGQRCEPAAAHCPLLAFAGEKDLVAPPASVREIVELVGASDKQLVIAPGGHVGLIAGTTAPAHVWQPLHRWLDARLD